MTPPIVTDYLVIGAGASAMAFVDTLLDESEARVVMVDRHERPGGHWNDAYSFVRLHQPSALYGVNSRALGTGKKDTAGHNEGLYELATRTEVLAYYEEVMRERFLPSGRVTFMPRCNHELDANHEHRVTSLLDGTSRTVKPRRVVDARGLEGSAVPSTRPPPYRLAPGVRCIPVNELPAIASPPTGYVVIGAGKTGIDACLWLLDNGTPPSRIRWIVPRDAWFLDRANIQPGLEFLERYVGNLADQLECLGAAASVPDLFQRLEGRGQLLRLNPSVEPTTFRCATVTRSELDELRRIEGVVRRGRVQAIERDRIVLDAGSIGADPGWLYVDCTANGLGSTPKSAVFEGATVRLLPLGWCQTTLSAAIIGYVECHVESDADKNALCGVVPYPEVPMDWLRLWAGAAKNRQRWTAHPGLASWLTRARLDTRRLLHAIGKDEVAKRAAVERYHASVGPAMERLPRLLLQTS